jgi:hypothetical protein
MMDGLTLPPSPMQALQAEHERLLGRLDDVGGVPCAGPNLPPIEKLPSNTQALIHEARAYIDRAKTESEWISDGRDRSQLRANLRFWASYLVNCTGAYPDTTLRPARPFMGEFPGQASTPPVIYGDEGVSGEEAFASNEAPVLDLDDLEPEGDADDTGITSDGDAAMTHARPFWYARLSRFFGLIAILIVGVIPLAAVCLALGLFYNLDNRNPWSASDSATQTAMVVQQLSSPTPSPILTAEAGPAPGLPSPTPVAEQPILFAQVTTGQPSPAGADCAPVLALSLDVPETTGGMPIPAADVAVYPAGSDIAVASAVLEPGAAPLSLRLEASDPGPTGQDWWVQADHPWLSVEVVLLPGSLFENCAQNQVAIVYRTQPGAKIWQQVEAPASPGDLGLSWKILTWGPEALEARTWVAAISLQAAGGDGNYVYSADGDLATTPAGNRQGGVLPADQVVLEQAFCASALAQAGVTSAGKSMSRPLAVQLVLPECR